MRALFLYYWRSMFRNPALPLIVLIPLAVLPIVAESTEGFRPVDITEGFGVMAGMLFFLFGLLASGYFSLAELELSLPLSRQQMLAARLVFLTTVQGALAALAYAGTCIAFAGRAPYLTRGALVLIPVGCFFSALTVIASWIDYSCRRWVRLWSWGGLYGAGFVLVLVLGMLGSEVGLRSTPIWLALAFISLLVAWWLSFRLSLSSGKRENFMTQPDTNLNQPTWKRAEDWSFLAMTLGWTRLFKIGTGVLVREGMGPQMPVMGVVFLLWGIGSIMGHVEVWICVVLCVSLFAAPKQALRFFGTLPMDRKQVFRPAMFGTLSFILLGCALSMVVPHLRDRSPRSMRQVAEAREAPAKTGFGTMDYLFNKGVRSAVNQSQSAIPGWWELLRDRPLRVEAPDGYAKVLPWSKSDDLFPISRARYDPYSFDANDPWMFCVYQLERYLRERHGLRISADERATWKRVDPASDPRQRVAGILASTWERIAAADLKIRTSHTMLFLSALWVFILGAYATGPGRGMPRKVLGLIFFVGCVLAGVALMTDWFLPFCRPLANALNPLFVAHFPWIGVGFLGWTVIWFLMTERRFETIEVSNDRQLW